MADMTDGLAIVAFPLSLIALLRLKTMGTELAAIKQELQAGKPEPEQGSSEPESESESGSESGSESE